MKFNILNRFTGAVQFTAEIDCSVDSLPSIKLGLAVKAAVKDGANLQRANLQRANLQRANLQRANLDGASLRNASLDGASLDGANLQRANLDGASLRNASLDGASLDGANLRNANLDGASLRNASLDGASLDGANLRNANLDGASGNNLHIKTIQAGDYVVTYTDTVMQIGCQRHSIEEWWNFDNRRIADMDGKTALKFWGVWKPLLQQIIAASPAAATGYVAKVDETTVVEAA